jgi:DNA-binding transcriptional LysR family regulator
MTNPIAVSDERQDRAEQITRRLIHSARPRQLQLVLRMAELGTIQKAANALGMSQPSATQALTQLESLLDLSLFQRHARGVRLTEQGELLLPTFQRVLASFDALGRDTANVLQGSRGLVRIVGISAASTAIAAQVLPALCEQLHEIWIDYTEVDASDIPSLCSTGEVDIALCRSSTEVSGDFEFVALRADSLGVYCVSDHPLTKKRRPSLSDLSEATWLLPPAGSAPSNAFMQFCDNAHFTPRLVRVGTRSLPLTLALMQQLKCLYVGLSSHMDSGVAADYFRRLPLTMPTELASLGLLRRREHRTSATDQVILHLLRRFSV